MKKIAIENRQLQAQVAKLNATIFNILVNKIINLLLGKQKQTVYKFVIGFE